MSRRCQYVTGLARRGCGCGADAVLVELADRFGEAAAAKVLAGEVVCADGAVVTATTVLPPGAHVYLYRDLPDEVPVPFDIPVLYRDDDIVVVDKPHFLATMPRGGHVAQTATVRLRRELDLPELSSGASAGPVDGRGAVVHDAARAARRVSDAVRHAASCGRRIWRGRRSIRRWSSRRRCAAGSSSAAVSYRRSRSPASRTPRH